ncbi:coiled-coil domain-containing protein 180-like isoform X2 [Clavelina lepadiformis]|uniref:coiled-coil domain-containing protein 180-like isoform X2 n=1 Tax=Clavelina lepadiformis TaxID=159417 RepID=UPI0040416768
MAEVTTSVRVLQSGKVYRQMFDAEVQLMKTFDVTKNKATTKGSHTKTTKLILPDLEETSRHRNLESNLTAANMFTERQKTWIDGMPNDAVTENPVLHRQVTTEAAVRLKETETDADIREVRGLPAIVHVTKKNSDIIQRIADKRKQRHDNTLDEMHHDLSVISNRVEPRITNIGDNLQKQLKEDDVIIEDTFRSISFDEDLVNFSHDQLEKVWIEVETHSSTRREWIKLTNEWFNQVEDERLEAIAGVLRKYTVILEKIASLPSPDIHRLIEKEAMMINQSVLANRRAYAKLNTNLLEGDIEREITQHRTWSERFKDWKKLNAEVAVKQFIEFMQSEEIVSPPEVAKVMATLLDEQKELSERRFSIMEQIRELKPPSSTKSSVYKWNTALTKAHEDIDKLHIKLLKLLHEKYETACQICLTEIEKYKQNLLTSKVCDEEDMRRIVNDHLLPLVGNQLRSFEKKLEGMDKSLENLASQTEVQLKQLFKFAQGAAHLWDVHELGLAKQERKLQNELEQTRLLHDTDNQERESKLDVMLDRLRQESSEEALNHYLEQCMEMLSHIKEGYEDFHIQQLDKVSAYPDLVKEELQRYDASVCKYYQVDRERPQLPEGGKKSKNKSEDKSDQSDESEIEKAVIEILTTVRGTSFYVPTVTADLDDSADDKKDNLAFLTEIKDSGNKPEYIENVFIDPAYVRDLKSHVRMSFLNHLEEWKVKALQNTEVVTKNKSEELESEVDLRLHLHAPRAKRIEVDVRNVRAAELVLHKERVARHCRGITAALSSLKHNFSEMTTQHDEQAADFRAGIEKMENIYTNATKSSKLLELTKSLRTDLACYIDEVKTSLREFRRNLDTTLGRLRESNAQCVRSFKLFCEGGNFSPDETIPLRKKLEKMSQKVDAAEGVVMRDLEGMESRRLDQATELTHKFEDKFRNHLVDLTFIENMRRWLSNAQVRIKTEVAHSNGMASEVFGHLNTLRRRVDACERPNIDKEHVTPSMLHSYVQDITECLKKRAVHLNVHKPTPVQASDTLVISHSSSDVASTIRPPSASLPTPSAGPRALTRSLSPGKGTNKVPSRQALDPQTTPAYSSRAARQATEDSAIGVIKNILRAQRGKSSDLDDARSIMTGTSRPPPSTTNSQFGQPARSQRNYQRQATLVSIAGTESDTGKRSVVENTSSGVYRRRESKFETKYMIFGVKPPEGSHFMAKIQQILYESLDGMLSTAEIYYKQKGSKPSTRPQLIQDNFDTCADVVMEKLHKYEDQADDLHNTSLQDFRDVLRELEHELCHVPRLILEDLLQQELEALQDNQDKWEADFTSHEQGWEREKKSHKHKLRPILGHPDQEDALKELSQRENQRQENHVQGIKSNADSMEAGVRRSASHFLHQTLKISSHMLEEFDELLTIDDVLIGRVPPRKELTSVLMRRRQAGYDMHEVADPSFGDKPIVERGTRQWQPPDCSVLRLEGEPTREITDVIQTTSTTLPHVKVAAVRDDVIEMYSKAQMEALGAIEERRSTRMEGEKRWAANWEESLDNVRGLYE